MSYLEDKPITSGGSSALDILNVLDILKNQDLYQNRLQELKNATKALNEGKYIGATMEQAKTLMEGALAAKESMEKEIKEKREQLVKERQLQEVRLESDRVEVQRKENEVKKLREELDREKWSLKSQREQLVKDLEDFRLRKREVDEKEINAKAYYERYMQKMMAIQKIMES